MKNARQVCSCTNVGELQFEGLEGSIITRTAVLSFLYFLVCEMTSLVYYRYIPFVTQYLITLLKKLRGEVSDRVCSAAEQATAGVWGIV